MRGENAEAMDHAEAVNTLASERYLLGEMSEVERDAFETHFFSCSECASDVRAGALMQTGAKAGLLGSRRQIEQPSNVSVFHARKPRRFTVVVPWAAAAALTLVTTYQTFWVVPGLREQIAPQALDPVVLRSQTRGAETVIRPRPGRPVTLVVEINAQTASGALTYSFQRANGDVVVTGSAAAPAAGTPLLLLIPSRNFVKGERYILSLKDAQTPTNSLGEYRFVVQTP
jgi:putative zinc finger protein